MRWRIELAASVRRHLRALRSHERALALDAIEHQLSGEPLKESRNRKRLRPNPVAPWELRVGQLRVFHEAAPGSPGVVRVLAVGKKVGTVLRIDGREACL